MGQRLAAFVGHEVGAFAQHHGRQAMDHYVEEAAHQQAQQGGYARQDGAAGDGIGFQKRHRRFNRLDRE
jgi:hypothetical protein